MASTEGFEPHSCSHCSKLLVLDFSQDRTKANPQFSSERLAIARRILDAGPLPSFGPEHKLDDASLKKVLLISLLDKMDRICLFDLTVGDCEAGASEGCELLQIIRDRFCDGLGDSARLMLAAKVLYHPNSYSLFGEMELEIGSLKFTDQYGAPEIGVDQNAIAFYPTLTQYVHHHRKYPLLTY